MKTHDIMEAIDTIIDELKSQDGFVKGVSLDDRVLALEKEIADLKTKLVNRPTLSQMYTAIQQEECRILSIIKWQSL